MNSPKQARPSKAKESQEIFDHILDIIEALELENLEKLLALEEAKETVSALNRKVEQLEIKLAEATRSEA